MAEFERGDIVVYVYPSAPEWHGTLGIVDRVVQSVEYDPEFRVYIYQFISHKPDFPFTSYAQKSNPWHYAAWEKVGHLDGF